MADLASTFRLLYSGDLTFERKLEAAEQLVAELLCGQEDGGRAAALPPLVHAHYIRSLAEWACGALTKKSDSAGDGKKGKKRKQQAGDAADDGVAAATGAAAAGSSQPKLQPRCWAVLTGVLGSRSTAASQAPPAALLPAATAALQLLQERQRGAGDLAAQVAALLRLLASKFGASFRPSLEHAAAAAEAALAGHAAAAAAAVAAAAAGKAAGADAAAGASAAAAAVQLLAAAAGGHPNQRKVWDAAVPRLLPLLAGAAFPADGSGGGHGELPSCCRALLESVLFDPQHVAALAAAGAAEMAAAVAEAGGGGGGDAEAAGEGEPPQQPAKQQPSGSGGGYATQLFTALRRHIEAGELPLQLLPWMAGRFCAAVRQHRRAAETEAAITSQAQGRRAQAAAADEGDGEGAAEGSRAPRPAAAAGGLSPLADFHVWLALLRTLQPHVQHLQDKAGGGPALAAALWGVAGLADALQRHRLYRPTDDPAGHQRLLLQRLADSALALAQQQQGGGGGGGGAHGVLPAALAVLRGILAVEHRGIQRQLPLLWPLLLWSPGVASGGGGAGGGDPQEGVAADVACSLLAAFAELRQLEVLLRSLAEVLLQQEAAAGATAGAAAAVLQGARFQAALAAAVRQLPSGQVPTVLRLATEGVGQLGSGTGAGALLLLDVYSCCLASLAVDLTTAAAAAAAAEALVAALAAPLLQLLAAAGQGEPEALAGAGLLRALLRLYREVLKVHGRCAGLHPEVRPLPGRHAQRPRSQAAAPGGYFAPLAQAAGGDAAVPQLAELLLAAGSTDSALHLVLLQAAEQQLHVRHRQLQYLTHSCPVTLLPAAEGEVQEEEAAQQRAAEQQAQQRLRQQEQQDVQRELTQLAGFVVAAAAEQVAGKGTAGDGLAVLQLAAGALPQLEGGAAPAALQALLQACLRGAAAGGGDLLSVRRRRLCCELLGGELLEMRQLASALPAAAAAELGAQLSAACGGEGGQPEARGSTQKKRKKEKKEGGGSADGSADSRMLAMLEQLGRLAKGKAVKADAWAAAVEGASAGVVAAAVAADSGGGSGKKRRRQAAGGEPAAAAALLAVQHQAQLLALLPLGCLQREAATGMAAVGVAGVLCCWQGGLPQQELAAACSCLALLSRLAEGGGGLASQLQLLPQALHAALVAAGSAAAAGSGSAASLQQLAAAAKHSRSVMQAVCAEHLTAASGGAGELQQLVQRLSQQLAQGGACERWAAAVLAEACLEAVRSAASSSDARAVADILRGSGASNQRQHPAMPEGAASALGAAAASLEAAVAAALPTAAAAAAEGGSSWQDALLAGSLFAGSAQLLRLRCCDHAAVEELDRRQQADAGSLGGMAAGLQAAAGLLERALPAAQQGNMQGDAAALLLVQPLLAYVAACCQVTGRMRPAASHGHYASLLALLLRALAQLPAATGWPVPPTRQTLPFAAAFPAAAATVAAESEQAPAGSSPRPQLLDALRELVAGSSSQQLLVPLRFAEAALPAAAPGGASGGLALPLNELALVLLEAAAGSRQQRLLGQHSERLALLLSSFVSATAFAPQEAAQTTAPPASLPQLAAAIVAAAEGSPSSGGGSSVPAAASPAAAPEAANTAPAAAEGAALCTALRALESLAARPKLFPLPAAATSSMLSCVEAVWTGYAEQQQAGACAVDAAVLPAFRFRLEAASGAGLFAASCHLLLALLRHRQQDVRRCLPLLLRTLRALLRFLAASELSAKLQREVLAPLAAGGGSAAAGGAPAEQQRGRRWRVKCAELLAAVMAELAALKEAGVGRYCPQLLADYLLLAAAPPSARSRALLHYASPAAALAASAGTSASAAAAAAVAEEDALAGEPLSAEAGAALRRGAYALYGACSASEIQFLYASLASGASGQRGSGGGGGAVASWRAALAALKADYERSYKYTGKV